jgi:hypothetical protein
MRYRDEPLDVGVELDDGGRRYRVERVEPPSNPNMFGYAWVTRIDQLPTGDSKSSPSSLALFLCHSLMPSIRSTAFTEAAVLVSNSGLSTRKTPLPRHNGPPTSGTGPT